MLCCKISMVSENAAAFPIGVSLLLRLDRFGRRLSRVFGIGQAVVAHGGIVGGEGHAVGAKLGVLELTPSL